MAIISNAPNKNLQQLGEAIAEIDSLIEQEKARKAKNDKNLSEKAQKNLGEYKTSYEVKLEKAKNVYQAAQDKLNDYISTLEDTYVPGTNPSVTYLQQLFGGDKDSITLARISQVLGTKSPTELAGLKDKDKATMLATPDDPTISVQRNFMDRTKDLMDDVKNCKGKVLTVAKGCLAFGLLEGITRGISHQLVAKLVVPETFGLLDLIKFGFDKLPELGGLISSGASMAWSFSPVMITAVGAFAVLKAIPLAKKLINWGKEKFNKNFLADQKFQQSIAQPTAP